MKRIDTVDELFRQARRIRDPLTGQAVDRPKFDPRLLPSLDWPVSPAVQHAIHDAVTEALTAGQSLSEACAVVAGVLQQFGISFGDDEMQLWVGAHARSRM
jgi:hypothetical protein